MLILVWISWPLFQSVARVSRMSGSDHAILDLGEDELQFTQTDYKAQVVHFRCMFKIITCAILDHWGFYDRIPCHGVTRFSVIKPGHSKTSGWWGQGGDIFQLLVPHFLSAALWHWHGWRKKQVHSILSCQKSKFNPLIYKSILSGWCTACYRCLENPFFSITSDLGAFSIFKQLSLLGRRITGWKWLFLGQTCMDPSGSVLHLCSGEANRFCFLFLFKCQLKFSRNSCSIVCSTYFIQHCNQRQCGRLSSEICGNEWPQMALWLPQGTIKQGSIFTMSRFTLEETK